MVKKTAQQVYAYNKPVAQTLTHGLSIASATGFIEWVALLGELIIPTMAAAFLAGCLVPVVQSLLNKLEN